MAIGEADSDRAWTTFPRDRLSSALFDWLRGFVRDWFLWTMIIVKDTRGTIVSISAVLVHHWMDGLRVSYAPDLWPIVVWGLCAVSSESQLVNQAPLVCSTHFANPRKTLLSMPPSRVRLTREVPCK